MMTKDDIYKNIDKKYNSYSVNIYKNITDKLVNILPNAVLLTPILNKVIVNLDKKIINKKILTLGKDVIRFLKKSYSLTDNNIKFFNKISKNWESIGTVINERELKIESHIDIKKIKKKIMRKFVKETESITDTRKTNYIYKLASSDIKESLKEEIRKNGSKKIYLT
jgi:hypothetical protein